MRIPNCCEPEGNMGGFDRHGPFSQHGGHHCADIDGIKCKRFKRNKHHHHDMRSGETCQKALEEFGFPGCHGPHFPHKGPGHHRGWMKHNHGPRHHWKPHHGPHHHLHGPPHHQCPHHQHEPQQHHGPPHPHGPEHPHGPQQNAGPHGRQGPPPQHGPCLESGPRPQHGPRQHGPHEQRGPHNFHHGSFGCQGPHTC